MGAFKKPSTLNLPACNQCHALGPHGQGVLGCPTLPGAHSRGRPAHPLASSPIPLADRCPPPRLCTPVVLTRPQHEHHPPPLLSACTRVASSTSRKKQYGRHSCQSSQGLGSWGQCRWPRVTSGDRTLVWKRLKGPSQKRNISLRRWMQEPRQEINKIQEVPRPRRLRATGGPLGLASWVTGQGRPGGLAREGPGPPHSFPELHDT